MGIFRGASQLKLRSIASCFSVWSRSHKIRCVQLNYPSSGSNPLHFHDFLQKNQNHKTLSCFEWSTSHGLSTRKHQTLYGFCKSYRPGESRFHSRFRWLNSRRFRLNSPMGEPYSPPFSLTNCLLDPLTLLIRYSLATRIRFLSRLSTLCNDFPEKLTDNMTIKVCEHIDHGYLD